MDTLIAISIVTLGPVVVLAQSTWHVDDDNCPGFRDGTLAAPFCTIQEGIDAAQELDLVLVAPGTYNESIRLLGKRITLRSTDGPQLTIISGAGLRGSVVRCIDGERQNTVLAGFTLSGGSGSACGSSTCGGGMYNDASSPTIEDCVFSQNSAAFGGGMYNRNGSSPTVLNSVLSMNTADRHGGGMYSTHSDPIVTLCTFSINIANEDGGSMFNTSSSPTVSHCTFEGSRAIHGGGMCNEGDSEPTVTSCMFTGNIASRSGGGIYNIRSHPDLRDCTFIGNTTRGGLGFSSSGGGGGISNRQSNPMVTNCIFNRNTAGGGGAMRNRYESNPAITNCMFMGNTAAGGGGGLSNYNSDPTVINCTFSANTATFGGAIFNFRSDPLIINCTVSANMAISGGGIENISNSRPKIRNSILWGDIPNEIVNSSSTPTIQFSDVQGSGGSGNWDGFLGTNGLSNVDVDPIFVRRPDDGGDGWGDNPDTPEVNEQVNDDMGDLRLNPCSLVINAGFNFAVLQDVADLDGDDDMIEPVPFDLDGNLRHIDNSGVPDTGVGTLFTSGMNVESLPIVDMGAFESAAFSDGSVDSDNACLRDVARQLPRMCGAGLLGIMFVTTIGYVAWKGSHGSISKEFN